MLLIAVLAVLASLMPAPSPALAQSQPPTVAQDCDRAVCLTVSVESGTELYIDASARLPSVSCGHFEAAVTGPNYLVHARSATICMTGPVWYSGLNVPTTNSMTVSVRFVSDPPTLGEPLVRF
jgi:hypothetical protein